MDKNIQQEIPALVGLSIRYVERKIVKEQREQNNITELFQTSSSDKFESPDGFVLCARTSEDGKSVALTAKDEGVRKCSDHEVDNSKAYGQSGYIGKLPKDMDCLADDPQRVVDKLVNEPKLFGRKFVVSERKKSK